MKDITRLKPFIPIQRKLSTLSNISTVFAIKGIIYFRNG